MNVLTNSPRTRLATTLGAAALLASLAACGGSDGSTAAPAVEPTSEAPTSSAPAASPTASDAPTSDAPTSTAPASDVTGSITADDQDSDGMTLTVANVDLQGVEGGWIAVHADQDGKPGPVIGTQLIKKGDSSDVVVTLDKAVTTGAVWPMLHVDDSTLGTYEFPGVAGADLPVMADGKVVVKQIMLTVA